MICSILLSSASYEVFCHCVCLFGQSHDESLIEGHGNHTGAAVGPLSLAV